MSHLFDAIQRSEAERAGAEATEASTATELLAKVETRAAEEWESGSNARSSESQREPPPASLSSQPSPEPSENSQLASGLGEAGTSAQSTASFPDFPAAHAHAAAQSRLVCLTDQDDAATEAFRLLAVRLRDLRRTRPIGKLLITSTIPQEGKSLVVANLGCMLTQGASHRVLLIDADLRKPTLAEKFGLGRMPGLRDYLENRQTLESSIYRLEEAGVWLLPAGQGAANALELLESASMASMMEQLTEWFDWILMDSPPLLPLADTSVLSRLADGLLLITRQGISKKRPLEKGLEIVDRRKLLGVVLNCAQGTAYGGYYYYRKSSSDPKDES
jgi:capsular exopolysaccharide synthesis family protein